MWGSCILSDAERESLEPYLSPRERSRFSALPENLASRYLAGRYLSRQLAASILQQDWSEIIPEAMCPDCEQDHGALSIRATDVNISVSYSNTRAVALAAHGLQIGIDLEQGVPTEKRSVGSLTLTLQQWCDYEAIVKADGRGIRIELNEVEFTEVAGKRIGRIRDSEQSFELLDIDPVEGFVISAAVRQP